MSERTGADSRSPEAAARVIPFPTAPVQPQIAFDRAELRVLFNLYGRMVSQGEWRDYALDFRRDKAVFSIYRRSSEMPLYRVEKDPKLARRQGARAWELRTATDLAALWADKPERARELLQPVFEQFAEGAETADVKAAQRRLAALG